MRKVFYAFAALLLFSCENREAPVQFILDAEPTYAVSEAAHTIPFSVTSNISWTAEVTAGSAWCGVTPNDANGNSEGEISVAENPDYLQERQATIIVTADDFTAEITVTQAPRSCPEFFPGSIMSAGETIAAGGAPGTINSVQDASGGGEITYQWYKDGEAISGATAVDYTPPAADAAAAGTHIYTRYAKDDLCNTAFTQSAGSWKLTVIACDFEAGTISSAGQTIAAGGTPETINSTQDASGGGEITYQWYKDGEAISGATAAGYTPPPADAAAAGIHIYTRYAKDAVCNNAFTQSAGSWTLTVIACDFEAGSIMTAGQTICSGDAVTAITSSADASGGDGNITYQWRRNGIDLSATNAATYNPSAYNTTIGVHTFTRWAKDGFCNTAWTQSTGQWVLEVVAPPQLTLTTGNNNQTVVAGTAIAPIQYVAVNASGVTLTGGSFPSGVSGSWATSTYTISGTPAVAGAYGYSVIASNPTADCASSATSGTITVKAVPNTPPDAASTRTWRFGDQIWSDKIAANPSLCAHTYPLSTTNPPPAEYVVIYDGTYRYNRTCVVAEENYLCPHPWRVPSKEDFEHLASYTTASLLISLWGTSGRYQADGLYLLGDSMWLWSSSPVENWPYAGYQLAVYDLRMGLQSWYDWSGCAVRCVR
jgi:hypothetical protein